MHGNEIGEVREDVRRARVGDNERVVRKVVRERIMNELKEMKGGKSDGMDGTIVKMLKSADIN